MNTRPFVRETTEAAPASAPSSVVVITTVESTVLDPDAGLRADVRAALAVLTDRGVPVVFWSDGRAADVIALQSDLGFRHPFICRGGTELYVPTLYFPEPIGHGRAEGVWTITDCSRPSNGARSVEGAQAIRLLVCLYRVFWDEVLIVGVGSEWRDRDLLHEVDVPVIITRENCDQTRIVGRFPDAYVTRVCGPAGWCEAILGAGEEG